MKPITKEVSRKEGGSVKSATGHACVCFREITMWNCDTAAETDTKPKGPFVGKAGEL